MSISELYDSGFRKRNESHFAAIVRVAMSNGVISDGEKAFLDRLARNLDITETQCKEILENYMSYPINPPVTYEKRLERLFDLGRMVYADSELGPKQTAILERLGVGLGFNAHNVKYVVDKALCLINEGTDLESFKEEIRTMNR